MRIIPETTKQNQKNITHNLVAPTVGVKLLHY